MRYWLATLALVLSTGCVALANEHPGFLKPTYYGPMSAREKAFVATVQSDLRARFPTAAQAVAAGYVRYTGVDDTGAISYANMQWQSSDAHHPSQLWYDKRGKLMGADYSRLKVSNTPPNVWGINPGRWWEFDRHMHYVTRNPRTGKTTYDLYVADDDFLNAGGSLAHPRAVTLVRMHQVKHASDVVTIFNFPAIWDLMVWVRPNPKGAFSYTNPAVKP